MLLVTNKNHSPLNIFNHQSKSTSALNSPYRSKTHHLVSDLVRAGHRVIRHPTQRSSGALGGIAPLSVSKHLELTPYCHVVTRGPDTSKDPGVRALLRVISQMRGRVCRPEGAVFPETLCSVLSPYCLTQSTHLLGEQKAVIKKKQNKTYHQKLTQLSCGPRSNKLDMSLSQQPEREELQGRCWIL